MASLTCLHLSDLHIGAPSFDAVWPNVYSEFRKDVRRLCEHRPIDVIAFTGDLVFRGAEREFELLDRLIERLLNEFPVANQCCILAVPGNHDLERVDGGKTRDWIGDNLAKAWAEAAEMFWDGKDPALAEYIEARFRNFEAWRKRNSALVLSPTVTGRLPGDGSYTITKDGKRFGFMALNTAFLQVKAGDYHGQLDLTQRQYAKATQSETTDWNQEHDFSVLLTHHPLDWIAPDAADDFATEILPHFDCHLFGHMHSRRAHSVAQDGGSNRRSFQGASICGIERESGGTKLFREHGYALFEFETQAGGRAIRYWGRAYAEKGGKRAFLSDPRIEYDAGQEHLTFSIAAPGREVGNPVVPAAVEAQAAQPCGLVGRDSEVQSVLTSLAKHRLVCLKGFGGIGKTAIARAVVNRLVTRCIWVDVQRINPESVDALLDKLSEHLPTTGLDDTDSVRSTAFVRVIRSLPADRIVVLDGFALISKAVSRVLVEFTAARPDVRILTTSWGQVNAIDVRVIPIGPLRTTAGEAARGAADAEPAGLQLFLREVRLHREDFSVDAANQGDVHEIVRWTAGVPLAIKLIAAATKNRTLRVVRQQLVKVQRVTSDAADLEDHHNSLSKCFDQCFHLLSADARELLYRLAVLPATVSFEDIEAIATPKALDELVGASFAEFDGERYGVHRLLKDFALGARGAEPFVFGEIAGERFLAKFYRVDPDRDQETSPGVEDWLNCTELVERLLESREALYSVSRVMQGLCRWLRGANQWSTRARINARAFEVFSSSRGIAFLLGSLWRRCEMLEDREMIEGPTRSLVEDCSALILEIERAGGLLWSAEQRVSLTQMKVSAFQHVVRANESQQLLRIPDLVDMANVLLVETRGASAVQTRVLETLATLRLQMLDESGAIELLSQALESARPGSAIAANLRSKLGKLYAEAGSYAEALKVFSENALQAPPGGEGRALADQADTLSRSGASPNEVEALFGKSIKLREDLGDARGASISRSLLALHLRRIGEPQRALEELQRAIMALETSDAGIELGRAYLNRGQIHAGLRDAGEALVDYQKAVVIFERAQHTDLLMVLDRLAKTLATLQRPSEAGAIYLRCFALLLSGRIFRQVDVKFACANADLFILQSPKEPAAAQLRTMLLEVATKWNIVSLLVGVGANVDAASFDTVARTIRVAGNQLRAESSWDTLIELYSQMHEQCRVEDRLRQGLILNELGSAYRGKGSIDIAIVSSERALKIFEECKFDEGIARANHKLGDALAVASRSSRELINQSQLERAIASYLKCVEFNAARGKAGSWGLIQSLEALEEVCGVSGRQGVSALAYEQALTAKPHSWSNAARKKLTLLISAFLERNPQYSAQLAGLK